MSEHCQRCECTVCVCMQSPAASAPTLKAMNAELVEALEAINEAADNYHSGHDDEGYVTVPVALIAAAVDVVAKAKGK